MLGNWALTGTSTKSLSHWRSVERLVMKYTGDFTLLHVLDEPSPLFTVPET
jgi:hypothetical protein